MSFVPERISRGFELKHAAHELLEAHRSVAILRGRRWLLTLLLRQDTATMDDVREVVELAYGVNPVCFGAVPATLAKAGIIEPDGFAKSRRRESHARHLQVWRLADRPAALMWLCDNPNLPDPPHRHTAEALAKQSEFDFENEDDAPGAGTPGDACN